jgi:hypothetical protein
LPILTIPLRPAQAAVAVVAVAATITAQALELATMQEEATGARAADSCWRTFISRTRLMKSVLVFASSSTTLTTRQGCGTRPTENGGKAKRVLAKARYQAMTLVNRVQSVACPRWPWRQW